MLCTSASMCGLTTVSNPRERERERKRKRERKTDRQTDRQTDRYIYRWRERRDREREGRGGGDEEADTHHTTILGHLSTNAHARGKNTPTHSLTEEILQARDIPPIEKRDSEAAMTLAGLYPFSTVSHSINTQPKP